MSRRSLLAATSSAAIEIPDPLPGDGGDPGGPQTTWPSAGGDTVLTSIRPAGRRLGVVTVDTGHPVTGSNKHTISAAMDAAKAIQNATAQGSYLAFLGNLGPDYRVDIIIAAGTYEEQEQIGTGAWVNLVGATGDPADVILTSDATGGGVLHSFGAIYMEGITVHARDNGGGPGSGPKYPWHITAGDGTSIAAKCEFITTNTGSTGATGMDGGPGTYTLFYRCNIEGSAPPVIMNMHGAPNPSTPLTIAWVDCTTNGAVSYSPIEGGVTDVLWSINTTTDGDLVDIVAGSGVDVHTSGQWPVPVGGVSPHDLAYYYPSSIGDEPTTFTPEVSDAAPMHPVAGRIYVTRVGMDSAARITDSGFTVTSPAGKVFTRHNPASSPPPLENGTPDQTLVAGENWWRHAYVWIRYPGDTGFWVNGTFSNAGASVIASADLPGLTDCYYSDDGVTLIPVAAGTPHPLPFIRAT